MRETYTHIYISDNGNKSCFSLVPQSIAVNVVVQLATDTVAPGLEHGVLGIIVCIQCLIVIKETTTYSEAAMQAILHNGYELLIMQQAIAIRIEYGKHRVNQMLTEAVTRTDFGSARKFICSTI